MQGWQFSYSAGLYRRDTTRKWQRRRRRSSPARCAGAKKLCIVRMGDNGENTIVFETDFTPRTSAS